MLQYKLKYLIVNKQTRLILLITVSVSLCISLVGLISYVKYRSVLDTELNTPNVELLQINMDITNRAFAIGDNRAISIANHPDTIAYLTSSDPDINARKDKLQTYLRSLAAAPDIQSIEVLSFDSRSVISSRPEESTRGEAASDDEWDLWISEVENNPLLIKRKWYAGETELEHVERLTLARPILYEGSVCGAVLVHMDYDLLFSKIYAHASNYYYVYNLDGQLIYPKLNFPIPITEMSKVIAELDDQPFAYVSADGERYMANQAFSDITGWRFISLVPMDQLLKNVKIARNMMFLLSILSIVVGCSAILYTNNAALKPLRRINQLLNPGQKAQRREDLNELEPILGHLLGDFRSKSLVAERSLPELRSKWLQDVIGQSIGLGELQNRWDRYFYDWKRTHLTIVLVSIDHYDLWSLNYEEDDQMLLKYALNNIILEDMGFSWNAVSIPINRDAIALLLQADDDLNKDHWMAHLQQDADKLIRHISQYLNMSVSIGIGTLQEDITQLLKSYVDAEEGLSYRLFKGYGCVHMSSEKLVEREAVPHPKYDGWKTEIIYSLMQSDYETSSHLIRIRLGSMQEDGAKPKWIYQSVGELLEDLLKIATNHGFTLPAELADYTFLSLTTITITDIEERLIRYVTHLSNEFSRRQQTKEFQVVQAVIDYMKLNLHQNIGLQEIADHVHLGISSISQMFKEETGNTVIEYLTRLRMDKACELLTQTSLKIRDIAQQCGYPNENSFIRVFRKMKLVTPGRFRQISRSSKPYADSPNTLHSDVSAYGLEK